MLKKLLVVTIFSVLIAITMNYYAPQNISAENNPDDNGDIMSDKSVLATFAGGCFWGVEAAFIKVEGVIKTTSGFMGGQVDDPTYREVCYEQTGHAEVVQVEYDPNVVTYRQLLKTFFECHNPTELNYQGPDIGTQYRSAIFYHNDDQKKEALEVIEKLTASKVFDGQIVTEVVELAKMYAAEDYHQQYYQKKGIAGHCGYGTGADLRFLLE